MMLLQNKKVAILGAGPVGLTMARLLQQNGTDVTVYERDKDAHTRISGGPLDLHKGSGQEAMKKAGLLERYYELAIPMGRIVADDQARIFFDKKPAPENRYDNPEINRNDLRKILLESLDADTVVWDSKFTGMSAHKEKWLLQFENKDSVTADLVIGANGGMSRARTQVTEAQIEYTGTLILQGEVFQPELRCRQFYELCNDSILMASGDGNLLVANPKNGGILSYSVTFQKPAEWSLADKPEFLTTESIISFLSARFSQWHEVYKQLFLSTSSFVVWPTRKISLEKPWNKTRPLPVTLIGDAAHIMPPFAGQGVNIGLMDALILSENLTGGNFKTIETAIDDYEKQMFAYATEAQSETSRNEAAMFLPEFSFQKRFSNLADGDSGKHG